ncbi:chalcone isomerase family protein [Phaeobacter porticola]|uniref:Chalcone isomerase domain-containing protein n=1 Tax=Phaeobacter porticola TaxID=1844006 RepID=A0A1L3I248_9RHOB|nr:chalcone isomerase family protein [Phaeobacter porticola]APG46195.1 hypothetical protein PhaeoP97_00757 [Phaeobacter porticola]
MRDSRPQQPRIAAPRGPAPAAKMLLLSLGLLLAIAAVPARANIGLNAPTKLGEVTFRWFGLPLYDASLYAEGQSRFDWQTPMALRLKYRRGFSKLQLMKATASELARIEGPRADQDQLIAKLDRCFQDVAAGDSFVATARAPDQVALYLNGRQTCDVRHPQARKRFLNIWLSPDSRAARLSSRLRGE